MATAKSLAQLPWKSKRCRKRFACLLRGQAALSTAERCEIGQPSGFVLFELQIQHDVLAAIKARYGARRGFGAVFFGVDFIVDIRIEPTEAVVALVVCDVAANHVGAEILQEYDARCDRILGLVAYDP